MNDEITNDSGNPKERALRPIITGYIVAPVEFNPKKLPDMRWKNTSSGFILQIRQAEIAGFDEGGVPHFTGRSWWADVPIFEGKD